MAQIWTLFYYCHYDRCVWWACLLFSVLTATGSDVTGPDKDRPPNFVLIMVDDLGIGDIGCYGNDTIRTPHIDRLASEGVRLTQHLAAAPLCTPSRAAFLTGRYALRSGKCHAHLCHHAPQHGGLRCCGWNSRQVIPHLKAKNIHNSVSKLYRGDHCHHPNHHGFSFFYGLPFTLFNDCVPGHGSDILNDLQTTLRSITLLLGLGLATLRRVIFCRNKDRPFLLFFSLAHIHTPLFTNPQFMGKSRHGLYGDNLEEVDWIVGQITETVDSLGLSNSTLMYFTSDHGDTWRTGTRRGRREAGTGFIKVLNSDILMDLYPTLKHLARDNQPDSIVLNESIGIRPRYFLQGTTDSSGESIFKAHLFTPNFSPEGAVGCYRTGVCMCHGEHVTHHNPPLLYDLHHDPSESRPLTPELEPRYHEALREVGAAVRRHRDTLTGDRSTQTGPRVSCPGARSCGGPGSSPTPHVNHASFINFSPVTLQ
uniref:Arylsulfatase D n=1 Tax=Neogobius melanostomus TaxID=47308 RepID=A0A8C6S6C8_9GOBI